MSFVLVVVLTASVTLAWFYSDDWANKEVTMGGAVGIQLHDANGRTSGSGNFHFKIEGTKAYPGESVEVQASVKNTGGTSGENGSDCFVRAKFLVYTNIGSKSSTDGTVDTTGEGAKFNASLLFDGLIDLIDEANEDSATYDWIYWENTQSKMQIDDKYYYNDTGAASVTQASDGGFFYLCQDGTKTLLPLGYDDTASFLWDGTFIIPWQLNNASADKTIFVVVQFQAIQTFIPKMIKEDGKYTIDKEFTANKGNRLDLDKCYLDDRSVQTVFNSSIFSSLSEISVGPYNGNNNYNYYENYSSIGFQMVSTPNTAPTYAGITLGTTAVDNAA
jgi:predicted ribosomally synthesized peptide with SipW-like signal peptide